MPLSRFALNLRRAVHPAYRYLETAVHPLRYLFLEITQKCNLRCLHCGSDCSANTKLDELNTEQWIGFIDYLAAHYSPKQLFIVITGGEPLCHPDLDLILARIHKHRFRFGMVTNGYGLSAQTISKLGRFGINSVTVSLDGTRASHDWLRGREGSFERAIRGIAMLARENIQFLDVVTCANPKNLNELSDVLALLRRAGVKRWRIFSIFPIGRAKDNPSLLLSDEQVRVLLRWIAKMREELRGSDFDLDFSCEGYLPKDMDNDVRTEPYFCRAGICIGSVLGDGSISACPNIPRSLVQGNIQTDDFAQVWEQRFLPFRDREWMKQAHCVSCDQWKRCKGNSLHLWDEEKNQTGYCHYAIFSKVLRGLQAPG